MAALRAAISLAKFPPEAHRPSRREISSATAAGIAEMGVLAVPPCWLEDQSLEKVMTIENVGQKLTIMVYKRALVKPEVPTRFLAVENSDWKSDWDLALPSDLVLP